MQKCDQQTSFKDFGYDSDTMLQLIFVQPSFPKNIIPRKVVLRNYFEMQHIGQNTFMEIIFRKNKQGCF